MKNTNYPVILVWSEADQAFLATCPQLEGCMSHGETREDALCNVAAAIGEWLESAKQMDWTVPVPDTHEEYSKRVQARQIAFDTAVGTAVQAALTELVPKIVADIAKRLHGQQPQRQAAGVDEDDDGYEYLEPPPWRG